MMVTTDRQLVVGICDTQPLIIEGMRWVVEKVKGHRLARPASSLEEGYGFLGSEQTDVVIVDKAFGTTAVVEWIVNVQKSSPTAVIVWGATMTQAEALRFLKSGASGIMRKTADVDTVIACLNSVAAGTSWMEDTVFREFSRSERGFRSDLTPREQQVFELIQQGMRNKEIARELGICPGTVKIHLKHIFEKTGVHGRYGLAISGLKDKGLVPCVLA